MVSTRGVRGRAIGGGGEAEARGADGGAEDPSARELRRRGGKLYVVAKSLGKKVTHQSATEAVGLDANAKDSVGKCAIKLQGVDANALLADNFEWMEPLLEKMEGDGDAAEAEADDAARAEKATKAAETYYQTMHNPHLEYITYAQAANMHGLDGSLPKDTQLIGRRVREMEMKAKAAARVDDDGDENVVPDTQHLGAGRFGRCGRKRKVLGEQPSEPVAEMYGSHGVSHDKYHLLVGAAAVELSEMPLEGRWPLATAAAKRLKDDHDCIVSTKTLFNRSKDPEDVKKFLGGRFFSVEFEEGLADLVRYYRSHFAPVFKSQVIEWAMAELGRNGLKDGVRKRMSTGWYYGWLKRVNMDTATEKPLEISRLEWATSDNLKIYFDNVKGVLLAAGVAETTTTTSRVSPTRSPSSSPTRSASSRTTRRTRRWTARRDHRLAT